ncbi:MAG: hypothetical protein A2Z25_15585 [Planctomycetes bacterium RBG_16_55_9]|nr:MAG: hypothetical protein A2Z25_15585 [Planctomycetes bacterium RBG_16_55_9]
MNVNWKQTLHLGKGTVLGLDIGSSAVKMVVLSKGKGGYSATGAGLAWIPKGQRSHADRRAGLVNAIRECFEQTQTKTRYAVCGVSGQDVAVRDFEFAPLMDDEILAAVSLEASQVCPFNVADIAVDYQVMPNDGAGTKGVLAAATSTIVTDKMQLVKDAGLKCVLMDVNGLALLNCHNNLANPDNHRDKKNPAGQSVAILNVGAAHATLAIMDNNGWPFIRELSQAGDDIIMQVAALNDASTEAVKEILFKEAPPGKLNPRDSLEKTCQKLMTDVTGTLRFYAAHAKSTEVDKLLVCGWFAVAKGFVDLLNSQFGMQAVLWNPFDNMRIKASGRCEEICTKAGPAMAVAAGLAMRTLY